MYSVAALYKFSSIDCPEELQNSIRVELKKLSIYGTILVGSEGINGTISGEAINIVNAVNFLKTIKGFSELDIKYSESDENPFVRLKIKLKKEIVTIGDDSVDPNKTVGNYVEPENWNELISDQDVILIDTRNDYECSIGTFKNAINPNTVKFREFPQWIKDQNFTKEEKKEKKIAMFCTGGIRCEKASSFMIQDGFKNVSHLKGGILNYFERVNSEESLWDGECFVFDHRVSVIHGLLDGKAKLCFSCRWPLDDDDYESPEFEEGVSCPRCARSISPERREGLRERQRQIALAQKRNTQHIGKEMTAKHKKTARPCTHE